MPVIDDVGSGALADGLPALADEPPVRRSVPAGAAVICFSGDKLLGGPQAGLMVGRADAIEACRRHPLARALRIDKLSLAALEATLRLYRDPERARRRYPCWRCSPRATRSCRRAAEAMARGDREARGASTRPRKVGGGALPLLELEGPVCAVDPAGSAPTSWPRRLRAGDPPVVGRIARGLAAARPAHADRRRGPHRG